MSVKQTNLNLPSPGAWVMDFKTLSLQHRIHPTHRQFSLIPSKRQARQEVSHSFINLPLLSLRLLLSRLLRPSMPRTRNSYSHSTSTNSDPFRTNNMPFNNLFLTKRIQWLVMPARSHTNNSLVYLGMLTHKTLPRSSQYKVITHFSSPNLSFNRRLIMLSPMQHALHRPTQQLELRLQRSQLSRLLPGQPHLSLLCLFLIHQTAMTHLLFKHSKTAS